MKKIKRSLCLLLAILMMAGISVPSNATGLDTSVNTQTENISTGVTGTESTTTETVVTETLQTATDLSNLTVNQTKVTYYNNVNNIAVVGKEAGIAVFTFSGLENVFDDSSVKVKISYPDGNILKLERSCDDNQLVFRTKAKYYGKKAGKQRVKVTFTNADKEQKVFNLKVFAYNLKQQTDSCILMAQNRSATAKLECQKTTKGGWKTISGKKVAWKSSNNSIATVNNKGKISTKGKTKTCYVKGSFENYTYYWAVNVTSREKVSAIDTARGIFSTSTYSQPLRMRQGYYDCSSLVWRSYRTVGNFLGTSSRATYAPTAAGIARYLEQTGKTVSGGIGYSNTTKGKLQAGDLLFEGGRANGRYRGVYHVEMFTGYDIAYIKNNGKPVYMNTWASKNDGTYGYGTAADFVCRP